MSSIVNYALLFVTVDGQLLTEAGSVSFTRNGGGINVFTMAKNFAGVSPGANSCQVQIENAIPAAGLELDPGDAIFNYQIVEIGLIGPGGKTGITRGYIQSDSWQQSVNAEGKMSFSFFGSFPKFVGPATP